MTVPNSPESHHTVRATTREGHSVISDSAGIDARVYDFARPDNLPSEFIRALENINATFARALSGMLTAYLTVGVQVDLLTIDQVAYRQFCASVPAMAAVCVFAINPLDGMALITLSPKLAWYLIDRGLGGHGEVQEVNREFTSLEKGLLDDLFRRVLREFGRAWESLVPMRPTLREVSSNATIARVSQPNDRMAVSNFNISFGDVVGTCSYCLPISSLDFERLLNTDNAWDTDDTELNAERERSFITSTLMTVSLTIQACLRDLPIHIGELAMLQIGDIVRLDARVDEPIEVRVAGRQRFTAQPVSLADQVAIQILDEITEDNHE